MGIGAPHPDYGILSDKDAQGNRSYYWNDPWHYALSRMMVACRAYGLRPIDGPFGDFSDPQACEVQFRNAFLMGCVGAWTLHPSQVPIAKRVFSPDPAEVAFARRVLTESGRAYLERCTDILQQLNEANAANAIEVVLNAP